jgi:hypothetical protein
MGRIQMADTELVGRMEELRKLVADLAAQKELLDSHQARVAAMLDIEREHSLA